MAQGLFTPDPSLWPYTPLYKERSRNNYTLHTPSGSPDGVVQHYTIVPSLGTLGQPVRQASALACEGSVCHPKGERKKEKETLYNSQLMRLKVFKLAWNQLRGFHNNSSDLTHQNRGYSKLWQNIVFI